MITLTLPDLPPTADSPAHKLRRLAAAVRVHFTWWGTHKTLTAQQKEEVGLASDTDTRFLTAGKRLIDVRHDAYRKLTSLRSQIVSYWRGLTLPYVEPGMRLIRQSSVESFVQTMERFRADLIQAERELNAVYDTIRADARHRLGRLYCAEDYPAEVRGLFQLEWEFPSVEPPAYLLRLHPEIYQQEQERVSRRFEEAVQLAEQAFVSEFARLVSHLAERLDSGSDGTKKVFRDTAVSNLMEFFGRFRQLNVGSNQELEELVAEAQRLVQNVTPQQLRDQNNLRQHLGTAMARMQQNLDGMLVDRPRRQLLRPHAVPNGDHHVAHH